MKVPRTLSARVMVHLQLIVSFGWCLALLDGGDFIVAGQVQLPPDYDLNTYDGPQLIKICQTPKPTITSVFLQRPGMTPVQSQICTIIEKTLKTEHFKVEENVMVSDAINVAVDDISGKQGKEEVVVKGDPMATIVAPPILDQMEKPKTEEERAVPADTINVARDRKPNIVKATPIGDKNIVKPDKEKLLDENDKNYTANVTVGVYRPQPNSINEETMGDDEEGVVIEEIVPGKEEDKITFNKWAEQKIKEQEEKKPLKNEKILNPGEGTKANIKTNGLAASGARLKKNYASPDCGAKIVGANPGSQGSGNLLISSRDEYFLNKCSDKSWFIVELCESIKALKIEIANFELFSSSLKEFNVYLGNVFPGRESDWLEFGHFTYTDERMLQSFKSDAGMVGKYIKVEIISYHGTEHYCPISVFKVYGISDIELMSLDDTDDDDDDDGEDTPEGEKTNSDNILYKTIKDAVDKVVNVFSRDRENQTMSATLNESSLNGATLRYDLVPASLYSANIDHYHMIYYLMATKYSSLREYLHTMPIERVLKQRCAPFGVNVSNQKCTTGECGVDDQNCTTGECGVEPWEWVRFLEAIHGEQFLLTLCNILSIEKGESSVSVSTEIPGNINLEINGGNTDVINTTVEKVVNLNITHAGKNEDGSKVTKVVVEDPVVSKEEKVDPKTEDGGSEVKNERREDFSVKLEDQGVVNGATEIVQPTNSEGPKSPSLTHSEGPKINSGNTQNTASQSTWQKLSNRIKALERNVTLSTGFLEELSLRYVKQIDELNLAVKAANDAIAATNKKQDTHRQANEKLEKKITELTTTVVKLNQKLDKLQEEVMTRHGLLLLAEVLCLGLVLITCRPNQRTVTPPPQISHAPSRRHSMEIPKSPKVLETRRRQSIEVATLSNGHVGSMVEGSEPAEEHLTKRQKRRRRKGSRKDGLKNVQEDGLEVIEDEVYATFHGNSREVSNGTLNLSRQTLQRSCSFSRLDESKFVSQNNVLHDNSRFSVEPVKITLEVSNGTHHYQQVPPREHHYQQHVPSREYHYQQQEADREQHYQQQGIPMENLYQQQGIVYQQRRARVSTPTRNNSHIEVSNKYGLLNHSVHDDPLNSEAESEKTVFVFPRQKKVQRSKSKSPSRQPNLMAKQRKVLFKNFRPENADWLKNT